MSISLSLVPMGSPSCGWDVAVYVLDINKPNLPTPFYSVLMAISVFMALSTVFHSMTSPNNSPLLHSVLPILSVLSAMYLFMKVSLNGFKDPVHLLCTATPFRGGRVPEDWGTSWLQSVGSNTSFGPDFSYTGGWVGPTQSIGWSCWALILWLEGSGRGSVMG